MSSGDLYDFRQDFALSGPFGLQFSRLYGSRDSQYQGLLGVGWRTPFDSHLDTSQASLGQIALTTNCGQNVYFPVPGTQQSTYDQFSGSTLTSDSDGSFIVRQWDGFESKYNGSGQLVAMQDRIGNTQTLTRSLSNPSQVTSISDPLGRQLLFSYDSQSRIKSITSSPSGISVTYTYDSGTSCYSGDLCAVRETDNSMWTYQYDSPSSYGGQHLLTEIIDPLGQVEEQNSYASIPLTQYSNYESNGTWTSYRLQTQSNDGQARQLTFSYSSFPANADTYFIETTVTDRMGRLSTFLSDMNLQRDIGDDGPECKCGATFLEYQYDLFGKTIEFDHDYAAEENEIAYNDAIFTAPDNSVSYIGLSISQPLIMTQTNYTETNGSFSNRIVNYSTYPFGDSRQDLIQTMSMPSVDTPGDSAVTTQAYASNGLLQSQSKTGFIKGVSTTYTTANNYDARGRIISVTGPRTDLVEKMTWGYFSDTDTDLSRRGQLNTITDPLGHVTTFANASSPNNTYTRYGSPLSRTDPNGVVDVYAHDAMGRLTSETLNPAGNETTAAKTTYTYDTAGELTKLGFPLGNALELGYDAEHELYSKSTVSSTGSVLDQLVRSFDPSGAPAATSFLTCQPMCTTTRVENYQTTNQAQINQLDFPTSTSRNEVVGLGGSSLSYGSAVKPYDGHVIRKLFYDPNNVLVQQYSMSYDYANHLTAETTGSGAGASGATYGYDSNGDLVSQSTLSTSGAATLSSQFDDFGRPTSTTSSAQGTSSFSYDPDSNILNRTDATGATTSTTYDALDRPLVSTSSRSGFPTETVTYAYDSKTVGSFGIGRLGSVTDPSGSTTYTYERRGKASSVVHVVSGTALSDSYTYDNNGNRVTITYPSGKIITYKYDYADRVASILNGSASLVSSVTYEPFGPITSITYGNGTLQSLSWDQSYRITADGLKGPGGSTLASLSYTEDANSRITSITDNQNSANNLTLGYGPNTSASALASFNTGANLWGTGTLTLDPSYQITALSFSNYHSSTHSLQFVAGTVSGQPQNVKVDGNSSSIAFDQSGELTQLGTLAFIYSPRSLLSSGEGIQYAYNFMGQRVSSTKGSRKVKAVYDDVDANLLYESAPSGTGTAHEYVWLGDRLVTEFSGASTFSAFTDHLATPTILTNSSGAVAWQADFEPFGKVYDLRTADMHQPIRRLGQIATQFDDGAGPDGDSILEYNHARWYNPAWGSYTQPEPMSAMGQTEPYTYVEDDPYSKTDQTGNCYVQAFYDLPNIGGVPSPGFFHETIVVSPSNYAGDIPITTDSQGRTLVPAFYAGQPSNSFHLSVVSGAWTSHAIQYHNYTKYNALQSPEIIKEVADDEDCSKTCAKLDQVQKKFMTDNMDYSAWGQQRDATEDGHWFYWANSNTFAYYATAALGVPPESVPHPWLPGYGPLPPLPNDVGR